MKLVNVNAATILEGFFNSSESDQYNLLASILGYHVQAINAGSTLTDKIVETMRDKDSKASPGLLLGQFVSTCSHIVSSAVLLTEIAADVDDEENVKKFGRIAEHYEALVLKCDKNGTMVEVEGE
jgi:hypothetical protein